MYQSRKEDLNQDVIGRTKKANEISDQLKQIEEDLERLYSFAKEANKFIKIEFAYGPRYVTFGEDNYASLSNINKDMLMAYIVHLEAKRERLITEFNNLK